MGTSGFLDPAYVASRHVTDKTDVYSFGVLLLTLVAGRRPAIMAVSEEEQVHGICHVLVLDTQRVLQRSVLELL